MLSVLHFRLRFQNVWFWLNSENVVLVNTGRNLLIPDRTATKFVKVSTFVLNVGYTEIRNFEIIL